MSLENRIAKLEEIARPRPLLVLTDKERDRLVRRGWTPPENALVVILTSYLTEEVKS